MNEICKQVSKISKVDDDYPLEEYMALDDLFVSIDTHKYFAYQGWYGNLVDLLLMYPT